MLRDVIFIICLTTLFSSCSSEYLSFVADDPLYRLHGTDKTRLGPEGEAYTQRVTDYEDTTSFAPREGESFTAFQQRIYQTLALQEHQRQELSQRFFDLEDEIAEMQEQLDEIQKQNLAMRMALNRKKGNEDTSFDDPLFNTYYVQEGDTLQKIARNFFGTYTGWLSLYRFNYEQLDRGPNLLHAGDVLLVPQFDEQLFLELHRKS